MDAGLATPDFPTADLNAFCSDEGCRQWRGTVRKRGDYEINNPDELPSRFNIHIIRIGPLLTVHPIFQASSGKFKFDLMIGGNYSVFNAIVPKEPYFIDREGFGWFSGVLFGFISEKGITACIEYNYEYEILVWEHEIGLKIGYRI